MRAPDKRERPPWDEALLAARLFAIDPVGTVGVALRAPPGLAREKWLAALRAFLPAAAAFRRLPLNVEDSRLLGGLDLAATLRAGRPIVQRGILAETDGGVLLVSMAERMNAGAAARLATVLDAGAVQVARDGLSIDAQARFGVVAFDEGIGPDERPPEPLLDRLAFRLDLGSIAPDVAGDDLGDAAAILAARERLPLVRTSDAVVAALCAATITLGIASGRAPLLALKAARAHAALAGRAELADEDAAAAARLVLAPRATMLPVPENPDAPPEPPEPPQAGDEESQSPGEHDGPMREVVLEAAKAAIPHGLLEQLQSLQGGRPRTGGPARAGLNKSKLRGRPAGTRRGEPRAGARLNVVETLHAAAPWQPLRKKERALNPQPGSAPRLEIRRDDFRVMRFKQRSETATIFVVDASGSTALHRLAEAKGAIALLLADCYVRRDQVALIAFRGRCAELLLPPTRSLVRAKRNLDCLPGGGGTPLAAGIDMALVLADQVKRRGQSAMLVFLTDGQANIARDGAPGRAQADTDAIASARALRAAGFAALLVDTNPQSKPAARRLATEMGATYLPLPYADATRLSAAVRTAAPDRAESRV